MTCLIKRIWLCLKSSFLAAAGQMRPVWLMSAGELPCPASASVALLRASGGAGRQPSGLGIPGRPPRPRNSECPGRGAAFPENACGRPRIRLALGAPPGPNSLLELNGRPRGRSGGAKGRPIICIMLTEWAETRRFCSRPAPPLALRPRRGFDAGKRPAPLCSTFRTFDNG